MALLGAALHANVCGTGESQAARGEVTSSDETPHSLLDNAIPPDDHITVTIRGLILKSSSPLLLALEDTAWAVRPSESVQKGSWLPPQGLICSQANTGGGNPSAFMAFQCRTCQTKHSLNWPECRIVLSTETRRESKTDIRSCSTPEHEALRTCQKLNLQMRMSGLPGRCRRLERFHSSRV